MTDTTWPKVEKGGGSPGPFEDTCHRLRDATSARCVAVVIIDAPDGSGYSVVGPLEAQVLLPDILEQMAAALRQQLFRNLQ